MSIRIQSRPMLLCLRGLSCVCFFHLDLNYWMFGGKLQSLAFLACDLPLHVFSRLSCSSAGEMDDVTVTSASSHTGTRRCKYMLLFHFTVNIPSSLPHLSLKSWRALGHPCIAALSNQLNLKSPSLICPLVTAIFLFFRHPASSSFFALGHAVRSGPPHFLCIIDCVCLPVPFIPSVPSSFLLLFFSSVHFCSSPVTSVSLYHPIYPSELTLPAHSHSPSTPDDPKTIRYLNFSQRFAARSNPQREGVISESLLLRELTWMC